MLNVGGDSAGGVIAFEGRWLCGNTFVLLDKRAVSLLSAQWQTGRLLTPAARP